MREKRRKLVTWSMIAYELRNVTGNPFIHIFGVGMPVLMSILIARMAVDQMGAAMARTVQTSVFLGIGVLIPMATILMGYSVMQAQDLERGIPVRLRRFLSTLGWELLRWSLRLRAYPAPYSTACALWCFPLSAL